MSYRDLQEFWDSVEIDSGLFRTHESGSGDRPHSRFCSLCEWHRSCATQQSAHAETFAHLRDRHVIRGTAFAARVEALAQEPTR
mgnify:FL=1